MREVFISPSLLAADKNNLLCEANSVISLGAKYLHFDVMDNDFIGHESFSIADFDSFAKDHSVINDVHIMVAKPYEFAKEYASHGAHIITFHYEALKSDLDRFDCIDAIHRLGVKVGISIKPKTAVEKILPFLEHVDLVLIMSVEPGLGGQSFIYSALEKVSICRKYINENKLNTLIEVDGGLNDSTGPSCYYAGADILVMGSYLFGHSDIASRYNKVITACKHE